jgi:drug/metabolite transporter (DMT)-like permease
VPSISAAWGTMKIHIRKKETRVSAAQAPRASVIPKAMAWMALGGFLLVFMNALMRLMTLEMNSLQAQFLRYVFGLVVMLPLLMRDGLSAYRPSNMKGQWWRGAVHISALSLFFIALPHVPLADMTAILFTSPIFTLLGAAIFLREKVTAARWLAALVGFAGVIIVVWPHLAGGVAGGLAAEGAAAGPAAGGAAEGGAGGAGVWTLVMLAASPLFAASFLITKSLTRHDSPSVIVMWQNITVTVIALPLALPFWSAPTGVQWGVFMVCGLLGSAAHWCMTRAFSLADISATQPMRFLDLIWSALFGFVLFSDTPTAFTLVGGAVIVTSTVWIARREAMERALARQQAAEPSKPAV